jgi:proteasome lid subunit RPN8/RPN11
VAEEPTGSPDELDIEITLTGDGELPEGEDPALREDERLLPLGKPAHDPRPVMRYACLKQVLAHGQRSPDTEIGGVLLGEIWQCARGRVTEMREAVPAQHTDASLGHVTFSHESWQDIYEYMEKNAPELRLVGWYHTHPGFGVFFSEHDRFIQKNFFAGIGQVGVVIDPGREEVAAFETVEGEVTELRGIWIGAAEESAAAARQVLERLGFPAAAKDPGVLARIKQVLSGEK